MTRKELRPEPLPLHASPLFWGFLFAAVIFRTFPFGVAYFPILDDNNMYGVYAHMGIPEVLHRFSDNLRIRPFAVLFDVVVISRLWPVAWLAQGLLAGIQCLTLWLIHRCGRILGVPLGAFGLVFLALNPFGMEATWWMAASSRIVMGSFLTILSLRLLLPLIGFPEHEPSESLSFRRHAGAGHPVLRGLLFSVVHLLSLGFYEQYLVMSVFLSGIVILLHARTFGQRGWLAVPLINTVLMSAYYLANADAGNMAVRGALVRSELRRHVDKTWEKAVEQLFDKQVDMLTDTAKAGLRLALQEHWLWMVLIPALALGLVWGVAATGRQDQGSVSMVMRKLGAGLLLTGLPLLPFFVLENNVMAQRNFYPCLLGLALLLDEPARLLLRFRGWRWCGLAVLGCMSLWFLFGGVSEVRDNRAVSTADSRIAREFLDMMREERGDTYPHIYLFNTKARYPDVTNPHFSNGTAVDWAFIGLLIAQNPGMQMKETTLVKDGGVYTDKPSLSGSLLVGLDESLDVLVLSAKPAQQDGTVHLHERDSGAPFGHVEQTAKGYVFHRR